MINTPELLETVHASQPHAPRVVARTPLFRRHGLILLFVIALAAALRLIWLGQSPPGLNQDEAANAWNAYCLLKTGQDQFGVRWPIFYSRCLGENRSTLFMYLLIPFQAVGGLNVTTTRLPSVVLGILTVPLLYYVGARLFGRSAGLLAAALLSITPWHVQQCRWGHEAAIVPFLVIAPIALLLWAGLPFGDEPRRLRILPAALAGALAGISCYGYPAVRIFLPVFMLAAVLVTWTSWYNDLKTRRGAAAIVALLVGGACTFGPLLWRHLADPETNKRGVTTWAWEQNDPPVRKLLAVLARYPRHFDLDFLFLHGDQYPIQNPPETGQFDVYMLPLMFIGLFEALRRARASRAARFLLVWIVLYPVGDLLSYAPGSHALRSLPGLCGLVLTAALGGVTLASWIRPRARAYAAVAALAVVICFQVRFLGVFFGEYNRRGPIYHGYLADLLEACEWLRPRLAQADAVVITTTNLNMPYVVTLVGLQYDPREWFGDAPRIRHDGPWDTCTGFGKIQFLYRQRADRVLQRFRNNARPDHVICIVRPKETTLTNPAHIIYGPDGGEELLIFEQVM